MNGNSVVRIVATAAVWWAFSAQAADDAKVTIGGAGPLIGTMELLAEAYNKVHGAGKVEAVQIGRAHV